MKLTPLDIRKQEFKRSMRGFDTDEVEAFLGMVADELELLIREKNQLNDELIKLRTQLKDYQRVEQTLRDTLVKAHNTVEDTRANSRREAEIIIHEAELQADNIIKEAKEDLFRLRNEISFVKAQKESFAKRLKHLLESQIELLNVLEMDDEEPNNPAQKDNRFYNRNKRPQPVQEKPAAQPQTFSRPPIIINDKSEDVLRGRPQPDRDYLPTENQYPDNLQKDEDNDEFVL